MTAKRPTRRSLFPLSRYSGRGQGEGLPRETSCALTRRPSPLPSTSREYTGTPEYRERGKCDGALQILRFNWTSYVMGGAVVVATLVTLPHVRLPSIVRASAHVGLALAAFWMLASIVVSHWVYDRSRLMRWRWI